MPSAVSHFFVYKAPFEINASGGPLSCFGKKEAKETDLRGAYAALPRVRVRPLKNLPHALTTLRNCAFYPPGRAVRRAANSNTRLPVATEHLLIGNRNISALVELRRLKV